MGVSKVLVVGGGITGSVLSLALAQRGVQVDLVEISPVWHGVGHGSQAYRTRPLDRGCVHLANLA